jgi:bacterioferritin
MKGNPDVVDNLQAILAAEYHLNLQYRMDTKSLKFMGVPKVASKMSKYADRCHQFYQSVTNRLLVLGASPSAEVGTIEEQDTLTKLLEEARDEENGLCKLGIAGIQTAVKAGDETTAEKLRHIEERHEKHVAWIEQQLTLIKNLGESDYIAEML